MTGTFIQPFGDKLVAGDRWKWTVSSADYPADVWRLKYFFRGKSTIDLVSSASGSDHLLDALPADTGKLDPGSYGWQAVVEKILDPTEHYELARGMVTVLPNIEKAKADDGQDFRTFNQRTLDNIRLMMAGTHDRGVLSYQIGTRSLESFSPKELREEEEVFIKRVKQDQIEAGLVPASNSMVHVRFGEPR